MTLSSAVDVLKKTLDPEVRPSDPYLSEFHEPENEPESPPYDEPAAGHHKSLSGQQRSQDQATCTAPSSVSP
ncbi:hypothetical protein SRHO_G00152760 [Serrasalmus rhombeus]